MKTRTFAEIGDASWLLSLVEECLNCRHAYDRQDMLDMIKRNDNISHCEIRDSQWVLILTSRWWKDKSSHKRVKTPLQKGVDKTGQNLIE